MKTDPEGKRNYTLKLSRSGQWEVYERRLLKPVASFSSEVDAFDYTLFLAGSQPGRADLAKSAL